VDEADPLGILGWGVKPAVLNKAEPGKHEEKHDSPTPQKPPLEIPPEFLLEHPQR